MLGRLVVKNFGPIKDLDLKIDEKMFLIGPQANGKSTVAKLVYFFLNSISVYNQVPVGVSLPTVLIPFSILTTAVQKMLKDGSVRQKFHDIMGSIVYGSEYEIIYYYTENDYIKISSYKESDSKSYLPKFSTSSDFDVKFERTIYIPANRSLMTYLLNSSYDVNNLDKSIVPFIDMVHWHRNNFNEPLKELIAKKKATLAEGETINEEALYKIEELSKRIIKGELKYDNRPMIYFDGEKKVDLTYSSSGQQEAVWIIQMIMVAIFNNQPTTLIVEEPEAHLFPEAQRVMIEIMSIFSNIPGNNIIVTTHSPYILTSANNLIYAHQLGQAKEAEVSKIVSKDSWMNPDKVGAYFVANGSVESILDPEFRQIKAERIDEVSRKLNEEYDQLFDLED